MSFRDRENPSSASRGARRGPTKERLNCWEFMGCGREPGGPKASESGVCPAALDERSDGINGGRNGGRICWSIVGSAVSKTDVADRGRGHRFCTSCRFFRLVRSQEPFHSYRIVHGPTKVEEIRGTTDWPEEGLDRSTEDPNAR